jgi:uncharacterized protein DUF1840
MMGVMLIQFDSKVGRITMFGDVAVTLLKLMGHSGTVPGAILPADIPEALNRLRHGVASYVDPPPQAKTREEWDEEPPVPLSRRAVPLVQLLEEAAQEDAPVLWKQITQVSGLEV